MLLQVHLGFFSFFFKGPVAVQVAIYVVIILHTILSISHATFNGRDHYDTFKISMTKLTHSIKVRDQM